MSEQQKFNVPVVDKATSQTNTVNQLKNEQVDLPKVSMKHVLLMVFVFPVFFYPLAMLLSASLKVPVAHSVNYYIQFVVNLVFWLYPLVLIPIAWVLSRIHDRNPKLGMKLIISALVLEWLLFVGFIFILAA